MLQTSSFEKNERYGLLISTYLHLHTFDSELHISIRRYT